MLVVYALELDMDLPICMGYTFTNQRLSIRDGC
jgi:hypothetical protein